MDRVQAQKTIRKLAAKSLNVSPGPEAKKRMNQRKISWAQVIKTLQMGHITEGPALDQFGGWRCRVERFAAGENVKVAVSIYDNTLVVITCF